MPVIGTPRPLWQRIILGIRCWSFKLSVFVALKALFFFKAKELAKNNPTYVKTYDVRPMLKNRVFIPASHEPGTKIPLYIDIHGGGFVLCEPRIDDKFCRLLADKYNVCVVSINYRKAPLQRFPGLIHDAEAIAKAVIADPDLPVDHSRIALGGFSAGGNISLSIAQLDGIREKIKAIVPVYPVVDFSSKYKGKYLPDKEGNPDSLEKVAPIFNWAYVPIGQDQSDPLLSPVYATREQLPMKIFFVGAECDMLCYEAHQMAKKLAGVEEDSTSWNKNGIRWMTIADQRHGFDQIQLKGEAEIVRQEATKKTYAEIGKWLQTEAFT